MNDNGSDGDFLATRADVGLLSLGKEGSGEGGDCQECDGEEVERGG